MTNSLEVGSHLCDGCVTDASRLTGPGPWADVVPGQQAPREDTAIRACRRWYCVAVRLTPRPDGDPDDPRSPLYDALGRVPVVSSPPPDLSGAVAFLSRPGASPAGWTILERVIGKRPQADRILVAKVSGEAEHHAKWRELTADEEAAAVAVVLAHRPAAEVTHRRQAVFVSYRDKVIDTVLGLRRRASRLD